MADLVPHNGHLVDQNGELLDLTKAEVFQLAQAEAFIAAKVRALYEAKEEVDAEVIRRMDMDARWTVYAEDPETGERYTLRAASPTAGGTWNVDMLRETLAELVAAGKISLDAATRAVPGEMVYKPQAGELKQLAKSSPVVAEALEACRADRPPPLRKVRVTWSA